MMFQMAFVALLQGNAKMTAYGCLAMCWGIYMSFKWAKENCK